MGEWFLETFCERASLLIEQRKLKILFTITSVDSVTWELETPTYNDLITLSLLLGEIVTEKREMPSNETFVPKKRRIEQVAEKESSVLNCTEELSISKSADEPPGYVKPQQYTEEPVNYDEFFDFLGHETDNCIDGCGCGSPKRHKGLIGYFEQLFESFPAISKSKVKIIFLLVFLNSINITEAKDALLMLYSENYMKKIESLKKLLLIEQNKGRFYTYVCRNLNLHRYYNFSSVINKPHFQNFVKRIKLKKSEILE